MLFATHSARLLGLVALLFALVLPVSAQPITIEAETGAVSDADDTDGDPGAVVMTADDTNVSGDFTGTGS